MNGFNKATLDSKEHQQWMDGTYEANEAVEEAEQVRRSSWREAAGLMRKPAPLWLEKM